MPTAPLPEPASSHATASLRHLAQRQRLAGGRALLPEPQHLPLALLHRIAAGLGAIEAGALGEANAQTLVAVELIARLAERLSELQQACGGTPPPAALESLHRRLAAEMGLTAG